jgi:uridine kinase
VVPSNTVISIPTRATNLKAGKKECVESEQVLLVEGLYAVVFEQRWTSLNGLVIFLTTSPSNTCNLYFKRQMQNKNHLKSPLQ